MARLWSKVTSRIMEHLCDVVASPGYRKITCKLCGEVIYEGSSTGAVILSFVYSHFRRKHPEVYAAWEETVRKEYMPSEAASQQKESMVLISFHLPRGMLDELDELVKKGRFPNRSEAIRVAIRDLIIREREREKRLRGEHDIPIVPGR